MKRLLRIFKIGIIILILVIGGCLTYVKTSPKPVINSANNITLYDNKNEVFFKGSESGEWVSLDDISDDLIKATINTEDKYFYKHFGFDFLRIGKAFYTNAVKQKNIFSHNCIWLANRYLHIPFNFDC